MPKRMRAHRAPAEPEQRFRRDVAGDAGFQLVGHLGHGGDGDEIEIPEQPDPHHAANTCSQRKVKSSKVGPSKPWKVQ